MKDSVEIRAQLSIHKFSVVVPIHAELDLLYGLSRILSIPKGILRIC
ncbi:MAG: hypothetical protein LBF22_07720 [Deltaproteobacteria bacterium]|nr:hypothetical protein [Deltaproteobacteria bacterium]